MTVPLHETSPALLAALSALMDSYGEAGVRETFDQMTIDESITDLESELLVAAGAWRDGLIPGTTTSTQGATRRLRELVDRYRCPHPRDRLVSHADGRRECGKCGGPLEAVEPTPIPETDPPDPSMMHLCECGHHAHRHDRVGGGLQPVTYPCKECDCTMLVRPAIETFDQVEGIVRVLRAADLAPVVTDESEMT